MFNWLKKITKKVDDTLDLPYSEYEKDYTANDCKKKCIKLILNLYTSFDII